MAEHAAGLKVTIAKSAGFCFGVRRAVNTCYEQAERGNRPIYTYGPIIHNEQVVDDLKEKGVLPVMDEEALSKITEGTVIIRSHGVAERIYDQIRAQGLTLVDAAHAAGVGFGLMLAGAAGGRLMAHGMGQPQKEQQQSGKGDRR